MTFCTYEARVGIAIQFSHIYPVLDPKTHFGQKGGGATHLCDLCSNSQWI